MLSNFKAKIKRLLSNAIKEELSDFRYSLDSSLLNSIINDISEIKKCRERGIIYVGDNEALTRTIYGHKIYVKTKDLSLAPHILLAGC